MANEIQEKAASVISKAEAEFQKIEGIIEAWFVKHFHGNAISADTDKFNICQAAKEDLKTQLTDSK
jgi:hypothetical protein